MTSTLNLTKEDVIKLINDTYEDDKHKTIAVVVEIEQDGYKSQQITFSKPLIVF